MSRFCLAAGELVAYFARAVAALDHALGARSLHAVALLPEDPQLDRAVRAVDRRAVIGCCRSLPRLGLALHGARTLAGLRTPAGYWAGDV